MTTENNNLSIEDLEHFKKYGYCILKNVFNEEIGLKCQQRLWEEMKQYDQNDQSTWIDKKFQLSKIYYDEKPFDDIFNERLCKSIDQICGINNVEKFGAGWFTITFPGHYQSNESWNIDGHFHIDGTGFIHYPYSKEIGLILLILLSNIEDKGGGTAIAESSHILGIKKLIENGIRGCTAEELTITLREKSENTFDIIEVIGNIGDIILMHPLVLHARSKNLSKNVRFLCHPNISLKKTLNFNKLYSDMTILEQTTIDAISHNSNNNNLNDILKSITPEACEKFKIKQKINGNKRKLYIDDDEEENNNNNDNSEISSTMGFSNFGKK